MKKNVAIAVACLVLIGSANASDPREIAWMERGKDAVKSRMKDPDSAKFRNVYFNRGAKGIPMTCGEVNSKNSFGAYSGYQRFLSGGQADLTFLEREVSDFDTSWRQFCK